MKVSEKTMRETLSKDIQVSDLVNQRLKDTYEILERGQQASGKKTHRGRNSNRVNK